MTVLPVMVAALVWALVSVLGCNRVNLGSMVTEERKEGNTQLTHTVLATSSDYDQVMQEICSGE